MKIKAVDRLEYIRISLFLLMVVGLCTTIVIAGFIYGAPGIDRVHALEWILGGFGIAGMLLAGGAFCWSLELPRPGSYLTEIPSGIHPIIFFGLVDKQSGSTLLILEISHWPVLFKVPTTSALGSIAVTTVKTIDHRVCLHVVRDGSYCNIAIVTSEVADMIGKGEYEAAALIVARESEEKPGKTLSVLLEKNADRSPAPPDEDDKQQGDAKKEQKDDDKAF